MSDATTIYPVHTSSVALKFRSDEEVLTSFASDVEVVGEHWQWRGKTNAYGYPATSEGVSARQAVWVASGRPRVVQGKVLERTCDAPECVRPTHMRYQNATGLKRKSLALALGQTLPEWEGRGCEHELCKSAGCAECVPVQ